MEREDSLYMQLHKLTTITNMEQSLDLMLTTLWKTRRTGLRSPEKSHVQSLLNLSELDPVLACLRSLIRKSVHENFKGDDFLKIFPPDLPLDLQSKLVLLLEKYQNQWKEEVSKEKHRLAKTSASYLAKTTMHPSFTSLSSSEISNMPLWPQQGDLNGHLNRSDPGVSGAIVDTTATYAAPVSIQHDLNPSDDMGNLPRLKSMTWTTENHSSVPENKIAIITLKLQDPTKSASSEMDVKFQLTKDALEAMLRSMVYIGDQLSNMIQTASGPAQKKQKQ